MAYYIFKVLITAVLVVVISEVSKKSTFWGGFIASVPTVSILAIMWLRIETKNVSQVAGLSSSIFWMTLPSLSLFVSLNYMLTKNIKFHAAFALALGVMAIAYFLMIFLLRRTGTLF